MIYHKEKRVSMKPAKPKATSLKQIKAGLARKAEVITKKKSVQKQAQQNEIQEKKRKKCTKRRGKEPTLGRGKTAGERPKKCAS